MYKKPIYSLSFALLLCAVFPSVGYSTDSHLLGWWRFDEGFGTTAIDASGNDRHGVLVDDPVRIMGVHGGGLQFSEGNHVAVPGYDGVLGTQSRTSAAWVNVTKTSASIIAWGPTGNGTKWAVRTHNGPASLHLETGQPLEGQRMELQRSTEDDLESGAGRRGQICGSEYDLKLGPRCWRGGILCLLRGQLRGRQQCGRCRLHH